MNTKRLTRSATDRKISGICGGLGEYFNVDPVIFRIVFCFSIFMGGAGLIIYLIMLLVIPEKNPNFQYSSMQNDEIIIEPVSPETKKGIKDATMIVLGALFILFGFFIFCVRVFPFNLHEFVFPLLLVAGGVILVAFSKKNKS